MVLHGRRWPLESEDSGYAVAGISYLKQYSKKSCEVKFICLPRKWIKFWCVIVVFMFSFLH